MENNLKYHAEGGDRLTRYLDRKKNQSKEEQYLEAGVLISEIEAVDTDKACQSLLDKIDTRSPIRIIWSQFSRIAAILIFPLLLYTIWMQVSHDQSVPDRMLSYQEITSPIGVRSKIILPDGSKVWLNAESKIRYTIPFVRETREVELVGEAFLDVEKNPGSPLEIKFSQTKVTVLGTRFNIKAFPDEDHLEVVLKEGSIRLEQEGHGQTELKPDQQWIYDKTTKSVSLNEVDADKYIAWHENLLILDKTPMAKMAKQLERWYGVKVEIMDEELYQYKFTTVFENEPLQRVIELLEISSPIRIRYLPGKLNRETGETEKSIIQIRAQS
ncbi:MAG: FecR family protein [Mangrovibacterium sp.]